MVLGGSKIQAALKYMDLVAKVASFSNDIETATSFLIDCVLQ